MEMNKYLFLGAIVLVAVALVPTAFAADLGRLFMTPQKRGELDELRQKSMPLTQDAEAAVPDYVRFDGLVLRSDGQHSAWFNGSRTLPPGLRLHLSELSLTQETSAVPVFIISGGLLVPLKPGQSLNTITGERIDAYHATPMTNATILPQTLPAMSNLEPDAD
jgi:hypothetical protein